jgi:hypothetical protein
MCRHGVARFAGRCGVLVLAANLLVCVGVLRAQEQTASIVGVVRDTSGGVVPGVTVTASDQRGLAVPTVTDESGRYWFPSLPPGRCILTTELTAPELLRPAMTAPSSRARCAGHRASLSFRARLLGRRARNLRYRLPQIPRRLSDLGSSG